MNAFPDDQEPEGEDRDDLQGLFVMTQAQEAKGINEKVLKSVGATPEVIRQLQDLGVLGDGVDVDQQSLDKEKGSGGGASYIGDAKKMKSSCSRWFGVHKGVVPCTSAAYIQRQSIVMVSK